MSGPRLEVDGLVLRGPGPEDFERFARFWAIAEPDTPRSPHNLDREAAWARLLRFIGHWSVFGHGGFLLLDGAGDMIGEVGVARFERGADSRMDGAPEAFWRISPSRRGAGLARRALAAILDWHTAEKPVGRINAMIDFDNIASLKTAERLGFQVFGETVYKGAIVSLLSRDGVAG